MCITNPDFIHSPAMHGLLPALFLGAITDSGSSAISKTLHPLDLHLVGLMGFGLF